jgi:hypothetical protein
MEVRSPEKAAKPAGSHGKTGDTERRFVQLAPESVVAAAESIGLSGLPSSVARALAEDASYRVREVASLCGLLLRHGNRQRLRVQDMNRALAWSGVAPVLGQGGGALEGVAHPAELFNYLPEAELFVEREGEVELVERALAGEGWLAGGRSRLQVTASWLAVEGAVAPGAEPPAGLSPALNQYYSALVSCILGDSEDLCCTVLRDIRTNPKLAPLLPYLVTFIQQGMKKHADKPKLNIRFLRLLSSLFSNPHLNLSPKPHLSHLVTALLRAILSPEPGASEAVPLAACILSLALSRWATQVNQLQVQTLAHLRNFLGPKQSGGSHRQAQHGALTTLTMLGPEVLSQTAWPAHLCSGQLETDAAHQPLWGALRQAGALRLNHSLEGRTGGEGIAFYGRLYEVFGESVVPSVKPFLPAGRSTGGPGEVPGRLRLRRLGTLRRRQGGARPVGGDQAFTASQGFTFLADMPTDIFDSEMDVGGPGASSREPGQARRPSYIISGRALEAFPGSRPLRRPPGHIRLLGARGPGPLGQVGGAGLGALVLSRGKMDIRTHPIK